MDWDADYDNYDHPMFMQASSKYGLFLTATYMGFILVHEASKGTLIHKQRIMKDTWPLASISNLMTDGMITVNDAG